MMYGLIMPAAQSFVTFEKSPTIRHVLTAALIALILPIGTLGQPAVFALTLVALVSGFTLPDRTSHLKRVMLFTVFHPIGALTLLTLLAWLPSIINSPTPITSLKTWGRLVVVVFAAAYLWAVLDRNSRLQELTYKVLLSALFVLLALTILAIHFYPEIIYVLRNIPDRPWLKYKAFASALACLVPVFVYLAWRYKDVFRWIAVVLIILSLHAIIASSSRSAIAGLVAAGLVSTVILAFCVKALRFPMMLSSLVLLGLVGWTLHEYATVSSFETGPLNLPSWFIDYHRQYIWSFVASKIPEAFWFGHGLNAIAHVPGADQNVPGLRFALVPSHPHNWVLEIFSETGIFGLLGILSVILSFLVHDLYAFMQTKDFRSLTRLAVIITFWTSSCFNFSIWAPWWGATFLVLMAILSARPAIPTATSENKKPKMLFSVTEGFAFLSHRLPMARAARASGYEVSVVCAPGNKTAEIESHGVSIHPWKIERAGTNPLKEFQSLNALRKIYEKEQPALVHHVAVKPVLYGAIAAQLANVPIVVNAMIGLGFLFINKGQKASMLRKVVLFLLKLTLDRPGSCLLVQNPDDAELFAKSGVISKNRIVLIPGSGVDTLKFTPQPEPSSETIIVSVVSRMLWDKGIGETVEAARLLKDKGLNVRIRLIGDIDTANPQSIPLDTLEAWKAENIVEWRGPRKDIQNVWAESHIALLPSYREGMPKALLEAAACARPLITTDAPGCRSLVNEDQNGLLVPIKDSQAIAEAIEKLVHNTDLRIAMGKNARQQIETVYADPIIESAVAKLYSGLNSGEVKAWQQ